MVGAYSEVRRTDLHKGNFTKAKTLKTVPKAEVKDVQGEAVGAFSWVRIWSFSSLEGDQGKDRL